MVLVLVEAKSSLKHVSESFDDIQAHSAACLERDCQDAPGDHLEVQPVFTNLYQTFDRFLSLIRGTRHR